MPYVITEKCLSEQYKVAESFLEWDAERAKPRGPPAEQEERIALEAGA